MARYPRYTDVTYSFGPGPLSPAIKALIVANVVAFLVALVVPAITIAFALVPSKVFGELAIYQVVTYMFLHGGIGHLLINMLSLWMFGTELERRWGTRFFTKYYFVTGIGAAVTTLLWSISPLPLADHIYYSLTIGASGAIFGVMLAYAMTYPNRPIYMYFVFPIPAKYFVMIVGAINLLSSVGGSGGGVAYSTHIGGLLAGYLYLKGLRIRPFDELKYRYLRWKMNRARSKFGVYSGGRDDDWKSDWKKHIH